MSKNNTHVLTRAVVIQQDHILLCKTLDLTNNFYYLPGGHIEQGESATAALHREMMEETGSEITIQRFLGCLENIFAAGSESCKCHNHEYSFIFEVQAKNLSMHAPLPKMESNTDLYWMPLQKLGAIPFKSEVLVTLIPQWLACDLHKSFESMAV